MPMQDITGDRRDVVADALERHGIRARYRGDEIRADCPCCGARRAFCVNSRGAYPFCGCRRADVFEVLGLPRESPSFYRKTRVPSVRDAEGKTSAKGENSASPRTANAWGVSWNHVGQETRHPLGPTRQRRAGNWKGIDRVQDDLGRVFAGSPEWKSYDSRRAATELQMQRRTVQRALDWLVAHNRIDERQLPTPESEVQTDDRGRSYRKSGVKQYRPVSEAEYLRRVYVRRDPTQH